MSREGGELELQNLRIKEKYLQIETFTSNKLCNKVKLTNSKFNIVFKMYKN